MCCGCGLLRRATGTAARKQHHAAALHRLPVVSVAVVISQVVTTLSRRWRKPREMMESYQLAELLGRGGIGWLTTSAQFRERFYAPRIAHRGQLVGHERSEQYQNRLLHCGWPLCPGCGWPERDCKCSKRIGPDEALPARLVAKLRMEKKGRGGKAVTIVYGLPRHAAFLQQLTRDLKRSCGNGRTTIEDGIELQGDLRDRVRDLLRKQGFVAKG
jgi:translation initiation factor 1